MRYLTHPISVSFLFFSSGFTANTIACMISQKNAKILVRPCHWMATVRQALKRLKSRYCISWPVPVGRAGNGCRCGQDRQYRISVTMVQRQWAHTTTITTVTMGKAVAVRAKPNHTIAIDIWFRAWCVMPWLPMAWINRHIHRDAKINSEWNIFNGIFLMNLLTFCSA